MLETLETAFYAVVTVGTLAYYAHDRLSTPRRPRHRGQTPVRRGSDRRARTRARLGEAVDDEFERIRRGRRRERRRAGDREGDRPRVRFVGWVAGE